MRPREIWGLSRSRASALLSPLRRHDNALSAAFRADFPARHHTPEGLPAVAVGVGLSLAIALLVWSCEGNPTGVTTAAGGGGGGGVPSGITRLDIGEPFLGTASGSDPVCVGPNYYYLSGPCQKFAIAVSGKAGTLTVRLAWDQPDALLALSATRADGWGECCQSPLTHQVSVVAGTPWAEVQVMLVGPKDSTGNVSQGASQKFTLTTSFSPQ